MRLKGEDFLPRIVAMPLLTPHMATKRPPYSLIRSSPLALEVESFASFTGQQEQHKITQHHPIVKALVTDGDSNQQ
jgi:hypothetical protein